MTPINADTRGRPVVGWLWDNEDGTIEVESSVTGMSWEGDASDRDDLIEMVKEVAVNTKRFNGSPRFVYTSDGKALVRAAR